MSKKLFVFIGLFSLTVAAQEAPVEVADLDLSQFNTTYEQYQALFEAAANNPAPVADDFEKKIVATPGGAKQRYICDYAKSESPGLPGRIYVDKYRRVIGASVDSNGNVIVPEFVEIKIMVGLNTNVSERDNWSALAVGTNESVSVNNPPQNHELDVKYTFRKSGDTPHSTLYFKAEGRNHTELVNYYGLCYEPQVPEVGKQ